MNNNPMIPRPPSPFNQGSPKNPRDLFLLRSGGSSLILIACLSLPLLVPSPPLFAAEPPAAAAASAAPVEFFRDIEPILVKRCSECHGPDEQKAKLRLDLRSEAFKGGKSGAASIVPGKSAESELYLRVTASDPDEVMPPKGDRLSPEQVSLLKSWIDAGAVWPDIDPRNHWAFLKPTRPAPPTAPNNAIVHNEIDRFILHAAAKAGLSQSPPADRATLIRRVTLDLHGLPPAPSEVDAFLKDASPDAYEKLVDRLLKSPAYGENLARWWLDLARYADSNGYQVDLTRSIWPYRDWVINALNRNQPFDQFTIEQLAGDLLPNPSLEQKIATGFNRNTKINDEGGGDAEEYRTKAVKDRVATTATTWLGLTMMCSECHSHKYDPISQEEYFQFYAFFNNTTDGGNYSVEPTVPVPAPSLNSKVQHVRDRILQLQRDLQKTEAALPKEFALWEQQIASSPPEVWVPLHIQKAVSTGGSVFTNLPDQSILATGVNPIYDTITVEAETNLRGITAFLLETLPDPSLPKNGPGRWGASGNFILDEFAAAAEPADSPVPSPIPLAFSRAEADWEQKYYRAEHAIDRNPKTGWAIGPEFGKPHFLITELKEPAGVSPRTKLTFKFEHYHGSSHTIGRLRLSATTNANRQAWRPRPQEMRDLLAVSPQNRTAEQTKRLIELYRSISPSIRAIEHELTRLNSREQELANAKFSTLILKERTEPRETYVHVRGNFLEKGKTVSPGVPAFLPPLPSGMPPNRLALAHWLVNPDHPLTARVTVNRLWERFFGNGLVKTSEDFGRQGELPSHPELLDWLATEFVRLNWDLKAIQRLMVLSAAYRQDAASSPSALEKDLYNRLLARGPRFRLDPEVIRDQALAVSGLLQSEIGGPSVYPVQPANLWKEIGFLRPEIGMDEWPLSDGPDLYRRGVYTFWRRVCTYPLFATFDAPSREVCTARRPRTNTPLQALAALNESTLLEAARALAQRALQEGGPNAPDQIDFAFRLCTARIPTAFERERLLKLFYEQWHGFERDPDAAHALLSIGSASRPSHLNAAKLAAWTVVANVLLNLDETLTKG